MAKMIRVINLWFIKWLIGWAGLINGLIYILTFTGVKTTLVLKFAKMYAHLKVRMDAPEEKGEKDEAPK